MTKKFYRKPKKEKKKKDQIVEVVEERPKNINVIEVEGVVLETLPNAKFTIKLDGGQIINAHVSGKMRMHMIKVLPGDRAIIEMTPYDLTKGRIVKRT